MKKKRKNVKKQQRNVKPNKPVQSVPVRKKWNLFNFFKSDPIPQTVQQSIPYKAMYADGLCKVNNTYYSLTIAYEDINYQLAQSEDKESIFENYCDFLNYYDSTISVQLTFFNSHADLKEYTKNIIIPVQGDGFDEVRKEYSGILERQMSKGNNGLEKTKYVTLGTTAKGMKEARMRLERIATDSINNFKVLGVKAKVLTGRERLKVLYKMLNDEHKEPFRFNFKMLAKTGMSTKDFIAPPSMRFGAKRDFQLGEVSGSTSYLQILAPELTDRMLAEFLNVEDNITVNIHLKSIDQAEAIKMIKRKMSDIDKMKIEEQKKAVRSGYDMDIIPSDLLTYGKEAKNLLEELQSRNERMFLVTLVFMSVDRSKKKLENMLFQVKGIAQKYNCMLRPLDYQQEGGFVSSLPLGLNKIEIQRALTTSSTAIFVPFTTQELFQTGEALYYGLNALSNNLIMMDRKRLKNPNGLILGTPGSGKSFSAKREIVNCFLLTADDIIISDPEGEYAPLVEKLEGQVVKISNTSKQHINLMDINLNYSEEDSPIKLKAEFIFSVCELIAGGKDGLEGDEISIIDQAVREVYADYLLNPIPENMPILGDLYEILKKNDNPKAKRIATCLEIYVHGSLNIFNHRTNVDIENRIVCFDIKELGKQLKKIGMLVVQDQVWNRVTTNRQMKKATRFYQDEFHLMLKEEQTAAYCTEIWKRFRKWGGIPTGITQNVKDLLASREIENILENSDFIYMLNQASGDRIILAKALNISPHQLSYVTNSAEGEGLLFYGNVIIPFIDHFPKDTELYKIMTTKPSEVA